MKVEGVYKCENCRERKATYYLKLQRKYNDVLWFCDPDYEYYCDNCVDKAVDKVFDYEYLHPHPSISNITCVFSYHSVEKIEIE